MGDPGQRNRNLELTGGHREREERTEKHAIEPNIQIEMELSALNVKGSARQGSAL